MVATRPCPGVGGRDVLSRLRFSFSPIFSFSTNVPISSISMRQSGAYTPPKVSTTDSLTTNRLYCRLEHFLNEETRTLVVISHDQAFLTAVVEETIILRNQSLKYFEGTPAAFEVEKKKEAKRLLGQKEALDKKREHIEKSIEQGKASAKKTGDENRQVSRPPPTILLDSSRELTHFSAFVAYGQVPAKKVGRALRSRAVSEWTPLQTQSRYGGIPLDQPSRSCTTRARVGSQDPRPFSRQIADPRRLDPFRQCPVQVPTSQDSSPR